MPSLEMDRLATEAMQCWADFQEGLIVGLLTAAPMTDDGIAHTNVTSPQDALVAISGPVAFELVQGGGKWDKENRSS